MCSIYTKRSSIGPTLLLSALLLLVVGSTITTSSFTANIIPDTFVKISVLIAYIRTDVLKGNFEINPCSASYIPAHCSVRS